MQLRKLLEKLAKPTQLTADERALLAAADAYYGTSDLAFARATVPVRCDNTVLFAALGKARCTRALFPKLLRSAALRCS